jgi:hypothetical protein
MERAISRSQVKHVQERADRPTENRGRQRFHKLCTGTCRPHERQQPRHHRCHSHYLRAQPKQSSFNHDLVQCFAGRLFLAGPSDKVLTFLVNLTRNSPTPVRPSLDRRGLRKAIAGLNISPKTQFVVARTLTSHAWLSDKSLLASALALSGMYALETMFPNRRGSP